MKEQESHGITLENVSEKLVEFLPELKQAYDKELQSWGVERPGPHVVYGDLLNAYIIDRSKVGDATALSRALDVVEKLASHPDVLVREIAGVSIVEYLGDESQVLKKLRPLMGPATLELLRRHEVWMAKLGRRESLLGWLRVFARGIRRLLRK